jgi:hypothetical protein
VLLLVSLVAQRHLQDLAPVFLLPLVRAVLFLAARDHPQVFLLLILRVLLPLPHDRPVLFRVALLLAAVSRAVLFLAARHHPRVPLLLFLLPLVRAVLVRAARDLPVLCRHLFQQLNQQLFQQLNQ